MLKDDGMGGGRIPYDGLFPEASEEGTGGGPRGGGMLEGNTCFLKPERTPRALPPLPDRLVPVIEPGPVVGELGPEFGIGGGAR